MSLARIGTKETDNYLNDEYFNQEQLIEAASKVYSGELIRFLQAETDFRNKGSSCLKAVEIANVFFTEDAEDSLNLSSSTREHMLDQINPHRKCTQNDCHELDKRLMISVREEMATLLSLQSIITDETLKDAKKKNLCQRSLCHCIIL